MKKIIFLFLSLVLSINLIAQNEKPIILKAHAFAYSEHNQKTDSWTNWSEWKKSEVIIVIDVSNSIVKINNQYYDKFYLLKQESVIKKENIDEPYTSILYGAIDKDGVSAHVKIKIFTKDMITQVYIYYSNIRYTYECNVLQNGA